MGLSPRVPVKTPLMKRCMKYVQLDSPMSLLHIVTVLLLGCLWGCGTLCVCVCVCVCVEVPEFSLANQINLKDKLASGIGVLNLFKHSQPLQHSDSTGHCLVKNLHTILEALHAKLRTATSLCTHCFGVFSVDVTDP